MNVSKELANVLSSGDQPEDAFYVRFESETEVTAISPRVRVVPLPVVSETYFSALRL